MSVTVLDNVLDNVDIIIKEIQKFFLNDLNFEFKYLLNRNSDSKTLYMKIDQKNIMNMNTLPICLPPPSNSPSIDIPPFGPSVDNSRYR